MRTDDIAAAPSRKKWRLEDSIFAKKPKENDSRGYWDRDGVAADVFDHDWAVCCQKSRFIRLIEKNASKVGDNRFPR